MPVQTFQAPAKRRLAPASPSTPSVAAPSIAPEIDEQEASLRGQFNALMAGGKVRPIDILTGGMQARDAAAASNAQRAADLARMAADRQQETKPTSPNTLTPQAARTMATTPARPGTTPTTTPTVNPPAPNSRGAAAATSWAMNNLGIPYSWGGGNPTGPTRGFAQGAGITGYDCSSFVQAALARAGVKIPRVTYDQIKAGKPVANLASAQPGDLLFPSAGHVMLYLGGGKAAEAPYTGAVTRVKPVTGMNFVGIRRVL